MQMRITFKEPQDIIIMNWFVWVYIISHRIKPNNNVKPALCLLGDLGYFNEDEYLFITGRVKELIKHKGFQVC